MAVGAWYPRGQHRLRTTLEQDDRRCGADLMFWDCWPPGSPSHQQLPFAFKSHAFRNAREAGYNQILWLDCSCWAVRTLDPIWQFIEQTDYCFVDNGYPLGVWLSDYCLEVFGVPREESMLLTDMTAMMMGVNMDDPKAVAWEKEFEERCKDPRLMNGTLHNVPGERMIDPHSNYDCGVISADPRVRGHSREQAVAGILAHKHGLTNRIISPRFLIQGMPPSQTPPVETIIQSAGM